MTQAVTGPGCTVVPDTTRPPVSASTRPRASDPGGTYAMNPERGLRSRSDCVSSTGVSMMRPAMGSVSAASSGTKSWFTILVRGTTADSMTVIHRGP